MTWLKFCGVVFAIALSLFIFSLDQCIMATAFPAIADNFNALDKMAWLVNSVFLTLIGFSLAYLQWCQFVPAKHISMFAILVFEIGVLVSSIANSVPVLLAGRMISGVGAAGLYNGAMLIVTETFELHTRAKVLSFFGITFGVAAVVGPSVGGTLVQHLSWRWCFFISLPFGMISFIMIVVLIKARPPLGFEAIYTGYDWTMLDRLLHCDWLGIAMTLAWGVCLIMAMSEGGRSLPWDSAAQIFLLVMLGVLPILFALWEYYLGKHAMLQLKILRSRNMRSALAVGMCTYASCSVVLFFLAEMLRALYNVEGTIGGLMILPLIAAQTVSIMIAGEIVIRTNLAWPLLVLGPFLATIASFMMSTSTAKTPVSFTVGLSVLTGIGAGIISQSVVILAQLQYRDDSELIGAATGLVIFSNNLGRFIGASIGSCIFGNVMIHQLSAQVPNLDKDLLVLVTHNAHSIWTQVPEVIRPLVVQAYRVTLNDVFIASACFGALGVISAFFAEWYRL
ncbi:MFS general substrate transporter [Meira miltonrushii]|uniref:MFS general substrate transporter n=1 Tax=Meira miltonrushii TaxID=1280837 RepID=A0A316VHR2_9BASI|nr:MFS general substrate transporter [Meira miltonrushii]PWN35045.1 MFS general substrate transporter [Meira miltonrushii]